MSITSEQVDEILTPDEVADILKVSKKTVLRLVHDGTLPAAKVGRAWRFRRQDVLDLVPASTEPT